MSVAVWKIVLPISTLITNVTVKNKIRYVDLVEKTMLIVRSCAKHETDTLLLAGEYEEFLQQSILQQLSVALIAESKSSAFDLFTLSRYSYTIYKQFPFMHLLWKLHQFVVIASSQPLLRLLLQRIKDSTWANSNGFYVLVDRKTEERGCVNAYNFLWTAWQYDLLSTVFLCIDPVEGLVFYTYNPYSSNAPSVWREAGRFKDRGKHPWILLKKKYTHAIRDRKKCNDLMFDKITNLNGYEVRLNAISFIPHLRIDYTKPGLDKFSGDNGEIVKLLFQKLNATLNVTIHNGTAYELGGVGPHGNMVGMLADVGTGGVDMSMNVRSLHTMWKIEHTYPHGEDGLCVITQQSGEMSEFIKILSFLSPGVVLGNVTVFSIVFLVLAKYQGFLPASLNIIRLIISVSLRQLPQQTSFRIFFSSVFLLFLVENTLLHSQWASLLTVPVSHPNIRTSEDLKKSNYEIYGSMYYSYQINDPVIKSRFHGVDYDECKERVLQSSHAACLDDCLHQNTRIQNDNLYRSKTIQHSVQVFVTRENWPLFQRVSNLIRSTVEAGLVTMWKGRYTKKIFVSLKRKQLENEKEFWILEIRHIKFSFYLLGIGYSCAAVVFVVEMLVGRHRAQRRRKSSKLGKFEGRK